MTSRWGDYIVHYDVHILDAVVWALAKHPSPR